MGTWINGFLVSLSEHTQGLSDHMLLKAVDYLGSRGAGLLIATQKLMSEEKTEETEKRQQSERRGVPLVKANAVRRKAKGRQKSPLDSTTLKVTIKAKKGGEKY